MTLLLVILLICAYSSVELSYGQNILDTLSKGFNDLACLATVTTKSGKCLDEFNKEVENRSKKDTEEKLWCCAVRTFRDCVNTIAKQECEKDSEKAAHKAMESVLRGVTSDECIDYGFISCLTVIQIVIAAAIVFVVLTLLSCVCFCCCCGKRRGRPV
jgi:hypothetical protein